MYENLRGEKESVFPPIIYLVDTLKLLKPLRIIILLS